MTIPVSRPVTRHSQYNQTMSQPEGVYPHLEFDPPPQERPTVYINMVATIDGKTISGERDEPVQDLGSSLDHATMRQIERQSGAVLIGAGSLRATKNLHYPDGLVRIVATASGNVPYPHRFFTDAPDLAFVATTRDGAQHLPEATNAIVCGEASIDWGALLKELRKAKGIDRLLVEGGSEINASLLKEDLVDELFLTLAPKIKLGRETPTYAGGDPLTREGVLDFRLLSTITNGNEVFVRYRRDR